MSDPREAARLQPQRSVTCKELVELVTEYFEGTLPTAERVRFESHLEGCQRCRNHLDQMRQTITLVGKLTEDGISPEASAELLRIFRNWKKID